LGLLFYVVISYVDNNPRFTREVIGYEKYSDNDGSWIDSTTFYETIYVSNIPQNILSQHKMMLSYVDKITSGFESIKEDNIASYSVAFYELPYRTKFHIVALMADLFSDADLFSNSNNRKKYLGAISFGTCEEYQTKWSLHINIENVVSRNLCIFSECCLTAYEKYKNQKEILSKYYKKEDLELIKYYEELQSLHVNR
jgi:hypothetical protein